MNRTLLAWAGAVAVILMLIGLAGLDYPLARWVRDSGVENAAVFHHGLAALDTISGLSTWYWLAGLVVVALGLIGLTLGPRLPRRAPVVLLAAGLVQMATIAAMMQMKGLFGRLRPAEALANGDFAHVWFAGGGSFPSGHSAFYFGLLLPLAAAAPRRWQRAALLAIPLFAVLARIDLARHFLSDVAASAVIASVFALIAERLLRRWLAPVSS